MKFDDLIAHLGEVIGNPSIHPDDDRHIAFYIGDAILHLQEIPELGISAAYAEIGNLPDEGREALLMQILKANWALHGTATLAIKDDDGSDDTLVVNRIWPTDDITPVGFIDALNDFLKIIQEWSAVLQDYRFGMADAAPQTDVSSGGTAPKDDVSPCGPNEMRIFL